MNHKYPGYNKKDIYQKKIINYSSKKFHTICKSPKKITNLKKLVNKEKKIIIFKKVIDLKILQKIKRTQNSVFKQKPLFFKTFYGSKDLFIFNKENKKSAVRGYFRKIELYPWNKKNKKIYLNLKKVLKLKCIMNNFHFYGSKNQKFYDDKKFLKIQLMHYPPKKGFLRKHKDGIYKSIIVLQIGMYSSSKSKKNGGLIFYFDKQKINLDQIVNAGDVAIYNPIIPHEVNTTASGNGKWSMLISSGYFGKSKGTKLQSSEVN